MCQLGSMRHTEAIAIIVSPVSCPTYAYQPGPLTLIITLTLLNLQGIPARTSTPTHQQMLQLPDSIPWQVDEETMGEDEEAQEEEQEGVMSSCSEHGTTIMFTGACPMCASKVGASAPMGLGLV